MFDILCKIFQISSWFNATVAAYLKHLSPSSIGYTVAFFVFYPIDGIYIWSNKFQIYFVKLTMQQIDTVKDKVIDFSKPIWYLERIDLKTSSITSSDLS